MAHSHWPLWDLRIRTPWLELRTLREPEMADLVELINGGLHDPATMPFLHPFTDVPSPRREREAYQHYWRSWATWTPEQWHLQFATYQDRRCVGTQSLEAAGFPVLRTVRTGSFVGRGDQGRGIGKEMRAAVLHLAFEGLGADRAETEAFDDNTASQRVTESLGYRPNGEEWVRRRDQPGRVLRYVLDRADWERRRRDDIAVEGLGAEALDQFGLG